MMIQTMVRLDPKVRAAAEVAAKAEGRTLSGWIKRQVHQALGLEAVDRPPGRPRKAPLPTPADLAPRRRPLLETAKRVRAGQMVDAALADTPVLPAAVLCTRHRRLATKPGPLCTTQCQAEWNR